MKWKLIIIIAVGAIMVLGVLEAIADDLPNISGSGGDIFFAFRVVTAFAIILIILGALYKFFPDLGRG